jgi:exosortase/archaeosortase family protein
MKKTYLGLKKEMFLGVVLFISLVYLVIPFIFDKISNSVPYEINFFSFAPYTLILIVLYGIFNREKLAKYELKLPFKIRFLYAFSALISFYLFFVIKYNSSFNFTKLMILSGVFYLLGIIFIAFSIFGIDLFRKTFSSIIIFSSVTAIFYTITHLLWQFWDILAVYVAKLVYFILTLFSDSAVINLSNKDPILGLNNFEVIIGSPCSGIDSLSMYLGLFLLLFVYEMDKLNLKRTGIVFIIGLIGTYFLNIFRVASLILIGTKYPDFALGMFHSQAGWIFFSFFLLVLLYFGYHWMKKR